MWGREKGGNIRRPRVARVADGWILVLSRSVCRYKRRVGWETGSERRGLKQRPLIPIHLCDLVRFQSTKRRVYNT